MWNVNGIDNLDDIFEFVECNDILCVYETWSISEPKQIGNCKQKIIYHRPAVREAMRGRAKGGLAVFINERWKNSLLLSISNNFIFLRINVKNFYFILAIVYISPLVELDPIFNEMSEIIASISSKYPDDAFFIGGDFNSRIGIENSFYETDYFKNTVLMKSRESLDNELNKRGI